VNANPLEEKDDAGNHLQMANLMTRLQVKFKNLTPLWTGRSDASYFINWHSPSHEWKLHSSCKPHTT